MEFWKTSIVNFYATWDIHSASQLKTRGYCFHFYLNTPQLTQTPRVKTLKQEPLLWTINPMLYFRSEHQHITTLSYPTILLCILCWFVIKIFIPNLKNTMNFFFLNICRDDYQYNNSITNHRLVSQFNDRNLV